MAKEKKSEEEDDDLDNDTNLNLISFQSNNLSTVPMHHPQKSNQWNTSKHDLDLNAILKSVSVPRNNFTNTHLSNRMSSMNSNRASPGTTRLQIAHHEKTSTKKLRFQGTDRNLFVRLLGINFDSQFGLDAESDDISSLRLDYKRHGLTMSELESVLKDSPVVVHVSTHGSHHFKATEAENEFQISFEETHILRALIDEDANFSAYYAVIALLFEIEMNHFVQYGLKHSEKHNRSLRTYIWCDASRFALLTNGKIYGMFCAILDRFGMHSHARGGGCIEIYWGQYKYANNMKKPVFVAPPHAPIDAYQLKTLYSADENVQEILRVINDDYNRSLANNLTIAEALKEHQMFSWEILSILLHRMLIQNGAEPDDGDDTQWMDTKDTPRDSDLYGKDLKSTLLLPRVSEIKEEETIPSDDVKCTEEEYADFFGDSDEDEYADFFGDSADEDVQAKNTMNKLDTLQPNEFIEDSSFFDDDDAAYTTAVKFGKTMDLIREIKVIPLKVDKKNASEMREMPQRLALFKDRLVKSIKKIAGIEIQLSQRSQSACNVYIMQFANQYALREAQKKVDKIRENPKYNHEYKIEFRHMSKADEETKKQVGFVKKMQEKVYRIDIVNKTDPISQMIAQHLKSRQECKIKLLILNGCHSFILGKIFSEYVENVICIHPFVKIRDSTATTFTKYFYQSLSENMNSSKALSQSVLASYGTAKKQVAKECPNDNACGSHSHAHPYLNKKNKGIKQSIERIRQKQHQFAQLHLSENWNELQKKMADPIQFKQYRREMQSIQAIDDDLGDIYDEKTLMLSNLSHDTMRDLVQYLEDHTANPHFVERIKYQKNEHYSEFNVAFLKFKSESDRRLAEKLLEQKQIAQTLEFSDSILFGGKYSGKYCVQKEHKWKDLGWMYRTVPPCCCSPHHAHTAEDKLILLQDGEIINRELIQNVETIKKGMKQLKLLKEKQLKLWLKLQEEREQKMPNLDCEMEPNLSNCSSYPDDVVLTTKPKKQNKKLNNRFDDDVYESKNERTEKNTFQNQFVLITTDNIQQNKQKTSLEKPKEIKKLTSNNNFESHDQFSRTRNKKKK
eukprot:1040850_1